MLAQRGVAIAFAFKIYFFFAAPKEKVAKRKGVPTVRLLQRPRLSQPCVPATSHHAQ